MSQYKRILEYLEKYKSITSMEAFRKFGATRLSAIIFNMKKAGHNIETVMEQTTNDDGNMVRYARYVYEGFGND